MRFLLAMFLGLFTVTTMAAVQTKEVTYDGGGVTMKGFLAWNDKAKEKRPGVIVVHEWWGHNDYARTRAMQLAKMGYVALAVDMYGDGRTANHPDNAMAFMQEATKDTARAVERFNAGLALLRADEHVDATNVAAIGYCFGGAVVLNMARLGTDLKGVASFHGALGAWAPAVPGGIMAKVLVMNGAADTMVPASAVAKFEEEMKTAGADFRVINYPGAKHSFTNPAADGFAKQFNMPVAYDAKADKASWKELDRFLKDVFTPAPVPVKPGGYIQK
jgi:dienelactone hydrolase